MVIGRSGSFRLSHEVYCGCNLVKRQPQSLCSLAFFTVSPLIAIENKTKVKIYVLTCEPQIVCHRVLHLCSSWQAIGSTKRKSRFQTHISFSVISRRACESTDTDGIYLASIPRIWIYLKALLISIDSHSYISSIPVKNTYIRIATGR